VTIQTGKQRLGEGLRTLLSCLAAYGDLMPEHLTIDLRDKVRECLGAIDEPESIDVKVEGLCAIAMSLDFVPPPAPNKGSNND